MTRTFHTNAGHLPDNIIVPIENAFVQIGYKRNLIQKDYKYADLFSAGVPICSVERAIFGQEPLDYRSACFGIRFAEPNCSSDSLIAKLRALGAPQVFLINNGLTERWAVTEQASILQDKYKTTDLPKVIIQHSEVWKPETVIRAKSGFVQPGPQQRDFIDIGLLPALEHEAAQKIDHLLRIILNKTEEEFKQHELSFDFSVVFRVVFSLLAAKLLKDRDIPGATAINFSLPKTALQVVHNHYGYSLPTAASKIPESTLSFISQQIGESFSLCNISVDTLTYIYENTFVSQENRQTYGIHSTPSYVADYVLSQMPIEDIPKTQWHVTDPMSGHGIFLIAAMRRIRDQLPQDWSSKQRHKFFAEHLHGIEIDPFSVEVARMCLMLADFPEPNGWDLKKHDVFAGKTLENAMNRTMVLVGNPPFENIKGNGPDVPKPVELLRRALPALPNNALIGLVLPHSFIDGSDYKKVRDTILNDFELISLTSLPDRIFLYSDSETAIIVARKRRAQSKSSVLYRGVKDRERQDFRLRHRVTWEDVVPQSYFSDKMQGRIVVPLLREIWERLANSPRLGEIADIKIGVQYKPSLALSEIIRPTPFADAKPGIAGVSEEFSQFVAKDTVFMSIKKQHRRFEASGAWELDWNKPKVVVPASRVSRGAWRYAAAIDLEGRIVSRRFYGIWPKPGTLSVELIGALLNSPVAQAFIYAHSFQRDIHKRDYAAIPIPDIPYDMRHLIDSMVHSYLKIESKNPNEAKKILLQIDAEILKLYKLSPRLERNLLDIFWGQDRRVPFEFKGYIPPEIDAWIPLHIFISERFNESTPKEIMKRIPLIKDAEFIRYLNTLGRE